MSPTDHRSDLVVYLAFLRICGDMQSGVPTMDFMMVSSWLSDLANPKSLILQQPCLSRMLAGLRSRWMMPFLCRYLMPLMMSRRYPLASPSGSLRFFCRRRCRSPSGHSSVTIYMLLAVWQMSCRRTMLWWLTFFMMSISDWMFLTLQALLKIFLSMTLTATGSWLSISLPRYTVAQEPCPSCRLRLNWYFSIFFYPSIINDYITIISQTIQHYLTLTIHTYTYTILPYVLSYSTISHHTSSSFTTLPSSSFTTLPSSSYYANPPLSITNPQHIIIIYYYSYHTIIYQSHTLYVHSPSIIQMSFRDTFTRNSNSSENLRYDDTAAFHFYITLLIVVALPLLYSLLKTVLQPFSHIPQIYELQKKRQFRDKIVKYKKDNRHAYLTFKFILKLLLLGFILYSIAYSAQQISLSKSELKGFDPYEILEVEQNSPVEKIRKAYRKLALKYHPDRNKDDPQAAAKFIIISKAYECLTNEEAKEKCEKYGNPDGASSFNVGIALPSFLVKKENHVAIMGIVFLMVVIVLPILLLCYHSEMNRYDDFGMLTESTLVVNSFLNQNFSVSQAIKMVACCVEFSQLKNTAKQADKLELMSRQLDQEELNKNVIKKKNYKSFFKKVIVLLHFRFEEREVATELLEDYRQILKKTPVIIKASISLACERSIEYYKKEQFFVGVNCIQALIEFGQYLIQGKNYEDAESFRQLDLSRDEIDRINKKKKFKKITDLNRLIYVKEDRQQLLGLLDPNRSAYINECIEYFPTVDLTYDIKVDEDSTIAEGDIFQVYFTITSNRKSNFCSSTTYPFLKMEGWHLILSDKNSLVFYEYFQFDELTKTFKTTSRQQKKGKYSLQVKLMSDCYYGLDIINDIKYEVTAAKKIEETITEPEKPHEESYIRKMLNSIMGQQQEEESDKEEDQEELRDSKGDKGDSKGDKQDSKKDDNTDTHKSDQKSE